MNPWASLTSSAPPSSELRSLVPKPETSALVFAEDSALPVAELQQALDLLATAARQGGRAWLGLGLGPGACAQTC